MRLPPGAKPNSKPRADRGGVAVPDYNASVFINCPFDNGYKPLFRATVFAVYDCGFNPRCALELYDSGQVRIDKIIKLVEGCRYGIHDISRTELDDLNHLPRFNMPLELGIFLGARHFGTGRHKAKGCLVLDREPYRYQKFISDIAGQDIKSHDGAVAIAIAKVRDWLSDVSGGKPLPGGVKIAQRFSQFSAELPAIAGAFHLKESELTFKNYANFASEWLRTRLLTAGDPLA